jgi:adenosylmethionine-8-amino-7-oxononanoate aminotransferase
MKKECMNTNEMLDFDREHIWHPYTSMTEPLPVFPVVSANGVRLQLADGRQLIDGMASWWCAIHGYNHPVLNRAVTKQLQDMSHVMFGGITHPQAVKLAEKLVGITPVPLQKIFFCDSGSVAVEVAIKMAIQFWYNEGKPAKNRLLTIRQGYHGDTFAAMSVCDPVAGMHHMFSGLLAKQLFAKAPQCRNDAEWDDSDIADFKKLIIAHQGELAAVILEPIVQGAGGMRFYAPEFLRQVRKLCDQHNVLLICDEIATGFGRTGKLFACEHAGISPDIMCLGKALTGGYMSFAAVLASEKVSSGICQNNNVFMHGPTFMANPLACAVANASIDLLLASDWQKNVTRLEAIMSQELVACLDSSEVADVRILGSIGVVELKKPVMMAEIQQEFVNRGVWVRPFGKLVYLMPPYIMGDEDLVYLCKQVVDVVESL